MTSRQDSRLSERELVRLVGRGDARAQRELYDRHAGYLSAVASRYLSDPDRVKDVLQDAFIRIFERFGSFRYRGEGSLRAWMTRIVINFALQDLRRTDRLLPARELPDVPEEEGPDFADLPLDVIQGMICRLPDGYRTVFNLFVFERLKHKEIAALLGIKENSSASQFLRARAMLVREIAEYRKIHG